jgi:hypothetical protein
MDITSFSLGISFAVVVGMLTVTVYNLFRVYRVTNEIEGINQSANANNELVFRTIEENKTIATMENETLWREFRDLNSRIYDNKEIHFQDVKRVESYIDSRLDKLIYRLDRLEREHLGKSNEKQLLND